MATEDKVKKMNQWSKKRSGQKKDFYSSLWTKYYEVAYMESYYYLSMN